MAGIPLVGECYPSMPVHGTPTRARVIPDKKVVWLVTDSKLNWIKKDKYEWTNTRMVFEITTKGDKTVLHFTHEGLVPEKECYAMCEQGWNMVIKEWLFNFITDGKTI